MSRPLLWALCLSVLVSLTGCGPDVHVNARQIIAKGDAAYPFDFGTTFYMTKPGAELADDFGGDQYASLVTPAQLVRLRMVEIVPILETQHVFQKIGHCYSTQFGFLALHKIEKDIYLASVNDDGCFDKSVEQEHSIYIVRIKGNNIHLGNSSEKFDEWAHNLGDFQKFMTGVTTQISYALNEDSGNMDATIKVDATKPAIYKDFYKSNRDSFEFSALPMFSGDEPTREQKEAYALTAALEIEAKRMEERRIAAEAEAKRLQAEQQRQAALRRAQEAELQRQAQLRADAEAYRRSYVQSYPATTAPARSNRFIDTLDPGDVYYLQGFFSDIQVLVVRTEPSSNRVKVRRADDGSTQWVDADKLLNRDGKIANDFVRGAATVAIIACALGGCEDQ